MSSFSPSCQIATNFEALHTVEYSGGMPWRMNLLASSKARKNIYFAALNDIIKVFQLLHPCHPHLIGNDIPINEPLDTTKNFHYVVEQLSVPTTGSPTMASSPINAIRVGDLGSDEILVAALDNGIICVWFTENLSRKPIVLNNEVSSWGIAMHSAHHFLAISSNSHSISLFRLGVEEELQHSQTTEAIPEIGPSDPSRPYRTLLKGHQHNIPSVDFSPCGSFVVSCSIDKTCRVWNTFTGECFANSVIGMDWGWSVRFINDVSFKRVYKDTSELPLNVSKSNSPESRLQEMLDEGELDDLRDMLEWEMNNSDSDMSEEVSGGRNLSAIWALPVAPSPLIQDEHPTSSLELTSSPQLSEISSDLEPHSSTSRLVQQETNDEREEGGNSLYYESSRGRWQVRSPNDSMEECESPGDSPTRAFLSSSGPLSHLFQTSSHYSVPTTATSSISSNYRSISQNRSETSSYYSAISNNASIAPLSIPYPSSGLNPEGRNYSELTARFPLLTTLKYSNKSLRENPYSVMNLPLILYCTKRDVYLLTLKNIEESHSTSLPIVNAGAISNRTPHSAPSSPRHHSRASPRHLQGLKWELNVHCCLKNVMYGHEYYPYNESFQDSFLSQFDRLNMTDWIQRLGIFLVASQRGLVALIKCISVISDSIEAPSPRYQLRIEKFLPLSPPPAVPLLGFYFTEHTPLVNTCDSDISGYFCNLYLVYYDSSIYSYRLEPSPDYDRLHIGPIIV